MGTLKEKVESVISAHLANATAELEEVPQLEKLSGHVTWSGFEDKSERERQRELWGVLRKYLTQEETTHLSIILTLTPAEYRAYLSEN